MRTDLKTRLASALLATLISISLFGAVGVQAEQTPKYNTVYADSSRYEIPCDNGAGRIIAILDNGFNLRHEMLLPNEYVTETLDMRGVSSKILKTNAYKMRSYRSLAKYTYRNAKIPFAFDYADGDLDVSTKLDHGTAMASASAGIEKNSLIGSGTAPAAQILAMKIFDDSGRITDTKNIIAALEDAYILGADVISLSLGSPAGFSELGLYDKELEETICELTEKGVIVVCSAGNSGALGGGSIYDDYYGYDYTLASTPDSGTVSTPSTITPAISVANADVYSARYPAIKLGSSYIPYSDSNPSSFTLGRISFNIKYDGKTFEYVPIGGIGAESDYAELVRKYGSKPLSGKFALVMRGEITFTEKINIAEKYGAEGVIIYDNTDEKSPLRTSMGLDGTNIYAILISKADGLKMTAASEKTFSVSSRDIYVTNAGILPETAPDSALGPTPTLAIKPEISASGEGVRLAAANGGYTTESGSSVSAAHTAGIIAGLLDDIPKLDGAERVRYVKNLLMTTAVPMTRTDENRSTKYFRVSYQGAGLINPEGAASAELLMTHNGVSKIELGNDLSDSFKVNIILQNLTDRQLSVQISALAGIPEINEVKYSELCSEKDAFFKQKGLLLSEFLGKSQDDSEYFTGELTEPFTNAKIILDGGEINSKSPDYTGAEVILPAGGSRDITIEFDISDCVVPENVFENGCLFEGFVFAKCEREYSVPLLGAIGDINNQNPFALSYTGIPVIGDGYLYSHIDTPDFEGEYFIGTNNIQNGASAIAKLDTGLCAVSPIVSGSDTMIYLSLSLTRNVKSFRAAVYSDSGELVTPPIERDVLYKAYIREGNGAPLKYDFWLWDCRHAENSKYVYPDGKYVCKLSAYDAAGNYFTEEIPFIIDTEKPEVLDAEIITEGEKRILRFSVRDNHRLQWIKLTDENMNETVVGTDELSFDNIISTHDGTVHTFEVELDRLDGSYIYITAYDMAFNSVIYRSAF